MGYIATTDQNSLDERYMVTALVVVALGLSTLIFLLIPKLVRIEPQLIQTINWPNLLYAAALLIGLTVVLLRRVLLSGVVLRGAAQQGSRAVLGRLSIASIICAAFAEMVGVLGLVGYLMTGESFGWPVGIIALILMIYSFPRRGEWVRVIELSGKIADK